MFINRFSIKSEPYYASHNAKVKGKNGNNNFR